MIVYVDIDETICSHKTQEGARDYSGAQPLFDRIEKINKMYDEGHEIVYWTARGTVTGINWEEVTKKQLSEWNAKHHDLKMGKPNYDIFICDKAMNTERFFKE
jgi:hypothetical protein